MGNGNIIKINGKDIKDVKATQDIADLKSQMTNTQSTLISMRRTFRSGGINSSNGKSNSDNNRVKTTYVKLINGAKYICKQGYEFVAFEYDLSGSTANYTGVKINTYTSEYVATDNATVVFVVRKVDNATITDASDIEMYYSYEMDYDLLTYIETGIGVKIENATVDGMVLVGSSGNETSNQNYSTTPYISVRENEIIAIDGTFGGNIVSNNYTGLYGYNKNKELVSVLVNMATVYGWSSYYSTGDAVTVLQKYKYEIPSGIAYVRMSSRTDGNDSVTPTIYRLNYNHEIDEIEEFVTTSIGSGDYITAFSQGSLSSSGSESSANNRIRSSFLDMTNAKINVKLNGQKIAFVFYDSSKSFLYNSGWKYADFDLIKINQAVYVRFVVGEIDDSDLTPVDLDAQIYFSSGTYETALDVQNVSDGFITTPYTGNVEVIMHRGYNSIAPENTIPAFKLARQMGFGTIETDVQLTSDGIPVILHDATIDRTSNGTGNVYDKTLAELKILDFGSWKSSMWAGTEIPTFEEMLVCCKKIGLKVYIEVKRESPWTQELISNCVNIVRKTGMAKNVAWISFSTTVLEYVRTADETAKLGYLMTTYTNAAVDTCVSLRTGKNEVMAVTRYDLLSVSVLEYMISNNVPLGAYMFDKNSDTDAMQNYVTMALTNEFNVAEYIYRKNISL